MKRIIVVCGGGMSSSLLVTKMEQAAKDMGYTVRMVVVYSKPEYTEFKEDVDIGLFVTGIDAVTMKFEMDRDKPGHVVMVAPQVRHFMHEVIRYAEAIGVDRPHEVIKSLDYGRLNGEAVLKRALELIELHNEK